MNVLVDLATFEQLKEEAVKIGKMEKGRVITISEVVRRAIKKYFLYSR